MGVLVARAATNDQRFFGIAQLDLKRGYDLAREFVLHSENIREIVIKRSAQICAPLSVSMS